MKNTRSIILIVLFIGSIVPTFLGLFEKKQIVKVPNNESYDSRLNGLDDISKLSKFIDSVSASKKITNSDTLAFVTNANEVVRQRFHYGFSNYTVQNNWPAFFGGKLIWSHLSAIVDADDILKHTEGLCSQQTIIFLELLKTKGITFRSIGLGLKEGPGHFLCEAYYNGDWHMYDITMEPNWSAITNAHKSIEYYKSNKDSLFLVYENKIPSAVLNKMLNEINYGEVNTMPAQHMLLFHNICKALIYFIPLLLLWLIVKNLRRTASQKR